MKENRAVSVVLVELPGSDRALNSALNDSPNRRIHPLMVVAGTTTPLPLMLDRQPSTPAPNCKPRVDPVVPTCSRTAELALASASSDPRSYRAVATNEPSANRPERSRARIAKSASFS